MFYEDRLKLFSSELHLIVNPIIREFTEECLKAAPDYVFEDCPSSSTGKYHPIEELGADGTILHTRKVFALAYELSRGLDCEDFRDEICSAALLHDMAKQGLHRSGTTVREHPQIMAKLVHEVYDKGFTDKLDRTAFYRIYYGVYFHYGPWTDKSVKKPIREYAPWELCVYMADYVSSKRFVHVDSKMKFAEGI